MSFPMLSLTGRRTSRHPGGWLSLAIAVLALIASQTFAAAQKADLAPEAAGTLSRQAVATATRHMVSAANPHAAEAGREILRQGGSAVDAAVTVALVLGLVEPQSSGLGGGGFLVTLDAKRQVVRTYDGREAAPSAARPNRLLGPNGPLPFDTAVRSGLSIGVPGLVAMLETAHRQHGRLAWSRLVAPAIRLAREGFRVSPRLYLLLAREGAGRFAPEARRYFFTPAGRPWPIGHVLRNPQYADTLEMIARDGRQAFYAGAVAQSIVKAAAEAPLGGDLTLEDLARYEAKERAPICFSYRARRVCGMGPPSSGGMTVAGTLLLLEPFDLGRGHGAARRAEAIHLVAEAEKLAYADRNHYVADPDAVAVPAGLLDPVYIAERRRLIDPARSMPRPAPGLPPGAAGPTPGVDATLERAGTTHISIIDGDGNAVALTASIEGAFGSHQWAAGFLLNNELTDFSFRPTDDAGRTIANAVGPGKRPRSSMSPTIVLDRTGQAEMVLGSVGGNRIILYVVKTLVALIDWQLDAQAAAELHNFGSMGGPVEVEWGPRTPWLALGLKARGHQVRPAVMTSGTHVLVRRGGIIEGGADPRREGVALGD